MRHEARHRKRSAGRRRACVLGLLAAVLAGTPLPPALSQTTASVAPPRPAGSIEAERRRTAEDLDRLAGQITLTAQGIAALDREIASLAADRDAIRRAMIAAASAMMMAV